MIYKTKPPDQAISNFFSKPTCDETQPKPTGAEVL